MIFSDYLYVDDYCSNHYDDISKRIRERKKIIEESFFAIILNEYTSKLEFTEWMFLLQRHYKVREPIIVGLAKDYDSAEMLTSHMIQNCLIKVGSLDYLSYLASLPELEDEDKPKLLRISGGKMYA